MQPIEMKGKYADQAVGFIFDGVSAGRLQNLDWESPRSPALSLKGTFVTFEDAYCRPQPCQESIPIIIGGHSKAAARRAGRLGDGYFPARDAPPDLIQVDGVETID
jgi:alkanesulfonate monooxygenase SsuD/methylene tetrahydromethanopterin reductase-like flavin-dependent oxidoreductase (luciferase family)